MITNKITSFFKLFWPYNKQESKQLLALIAMISSSLFMYTTSRIMKDNLILNYAACSGAEVLGFLKSFFVFPASILWATYIAVINSKVRTKNVYYYIALPFLIFFGLFTFVLYPFVDYLNLSEETIRRLILSYPAFERFIIIIGNWVYSLFYIFSELSGNTFITYLFWRFVLAIYSYEDYKKYSPLFGALSNFGLISAGVIQIFIGETIKSVSALILVALVINILTYYLINKYLLEENWDLEKLAAGESRAKKPKLSFFQSLKIVAQSKYLFYLGAMVLSYGIAINLCEQTWKQQVKEFCKLFGWNFSEFMGYFFIGTGVATTFIGLTLKNVVKNFGFKISALITPVILIGTSLVYLTINFLLNTGSLEFMGLFLTGMLGYLVAFGSIQNILGKGTKYALFDPTTQLAYKPLPKEEQNVGKAAIDIVFGRLGKSAGGLLQSSILIVLPLITGVRSNQKDLVPILLILTVIIGMIWIYSTYKLAFLYEEKMKEQQAEEKIEAQVADSSDSKAESNKVGAKKDSSDSKVDSKKTK